MTRPIDPFDFLGVEWEDNRCVRADDFLLDHQQAERRYGWIAARFCGAEGKVAHLKTSATQDTLSIDELDAVAEGGALLHVHPESTGRIVLRGSDLCGQVGRTFEMSVVATAEWSRVDGHHDALGHCARRRPRVAVLLRPKLRHASDPVDYRLIFAGDSARSRPMKVDVGIDGAAVVQEVGGDVPPVVLLGGVRLCEVDVGTDARIQRSREVLPRALRAGSVDWVAEKFRECLAEFDAAHTKLLEQQELKTNKLWERRLLARWYEFHQQVVDTVQDLERSPEEILAAYRQFYRMKFWSIELERRTNLENNIFPRDDHPNYEPAIQRFLATARDSEPGQALAALDGLVRLDRALTDQVAHHSLHFLAKRDNPPSFLTLRQRRYKLYWSEEVDPNRVQLRGQHRVFVSQPKPAAMRDLLDDLVVVLRTDFADDHDEGNCTVRLCYRNEVEPFEAPPFKKFDRPLGTTAGNQVNYHFIVSPPKAGKQSLANLSAVEFQSDPWLRHLKVYYYHCVRDQELQVEPRPLTGAGNV